VIAQIVFLMVLIVGTGLFVRTFTALVNRSIGFDSQGLLIVTLTAPPALSEPAERLDIYERSINAVRHVPGVVSAGASVFSPLTGPSSSQLVAVSGEAPPQISSLVHWVTPEWFSAYRTTLLAGRDFQTSDRVDSAPVAIVNEAFVKQFLAGRSALGHYVQSTAGRSPEPPREVVGVLADAVYLSVREAPRPTVYFPLAQVALPYRSLMYSSINMGVRVAGSPLTFSRAIASAVSAVSPDVSLAFRSMADQVGAGLAQERLLAILSGFFGGLALLLAALGLFGTTAYDVARRRTELGIRMALGAAPATVVLLVLARVAKLVGMGVLLGSFVSLWASSFIATLLYGLQPHDPSTLIGAVAILATVAAMAGWLPAWRASRIDPAKVLRNA
jgi:predicted permease